MRKRRRWTRRVLRLERGFYSVFQQGLAFSGDVEGSFDKARVGRLMRQGFARDLPGFGHGLEQAHLDGLGLGVADGDLPTADRDVVGGAGERELFASRG